MNMTDFHPSKHGFHFNNNFVNMFLNTKFIKIATYGRCGGMSYAALDYYFANIMIPSHEAEHFPNKKVPPDKSILADYIYKRSVQSIVNLSSYKFILWSLLSQKKKEKILSKCLNEEFLKLKESIDMGKPVVLGLINADKISDIFINHQVVAYGYHINSNDDLKIFIYDCNSHDKEVVIKYESENKNFIASNNHMWNSFFVQNYQYRKPEYVDLIVSESLAAQSLKKIYIIENKGEFTSSLNYILQDDVVKVNNETEILAGEFKTIVLN